MTPSAGADPLEEPEGGAAFAVELPVFEGPFRVLADLILSQQIDVCDVAIATITERFLAHANEADRWTLEEATWFLAVCAILLELKVGRLMPRHEVVDEEDLLGVSPDLLYARSIELAAFRTVVVEIASLLEHERSRFGREAGPPPEFAHLYPDVLEKVDVDDLARLAADVLRPPPMLDLSHVTPIRYTMAEAVRVGPRPTGSGRAGELPGPGRGLQRADPDRGSLPRAARAVPGGQGRPRAGGDVRRDRRPVGGRCRVRGVR